VAHLFKEIKCLGSQITCKNLQQKNAKEEGSTVLSNQVLKAFVFLPASRRSLCGLVV
jgi:hypothetical protein